MLRVTKQHTDCPDEKDAVLSSAVTSQKGGTEITNGNL